MPLLNNLSLQFFLPQTPGINWDIATAIAFDSSNFSSLTERRELQEAYYQAYDFINPLVSQASGLTDSLSTKIIICDRHEWIVNLAENMSTTFEDVINTLWNLLEAQKPNSLIKKTTQTLFTTEIGLLLGFLSQKVLGQYDVGAQTQKPSDLLFIVESNILEKEKILGAEEVPLRLWILAHELTHRLQFGTFPWMKDYYNSLIEDLKKLVAAKAGEAKTFTLSSIKLLLDKDNWELFTKTQAFMSFIEGYADYVMFSVGKMLPGYEKLKLVFSRSRPQNEPVVKRVLEKILGFEMKKSQYRKGMAFVKEVGELKSLSFLNTAIDGPEKIPTLAEITDPQKWLKRIG
jgi:coenzyme F420 biosynthesis associated uncharacterized protein